MSIRKMNAVASVFIATLYLTGFGWFSTTKPETHETKKEEVNWQSAKNKIGPKQQEIVEEEIESANETEYF